MLIFIIYIYYHHISFIVRNIIVNILQTANTITSLMIINTIIIIFFL